MNHTLTAAVALAVGLGMAGIAQAQMNPPPGAQQQPMSQTPSTGSYGATPQSNSQMQQQVSVSPAQIQEAQQQLQSQGLYHGAIDGKMGPETQNAISQFQRKEGLPATAQLDQETMSRLSSNQEPGASQTPTAPPSAGMRAPTTQSPATGATSGASGTTTPGH